MNPADKRARGWKFDRPSENGTPAGQSNQRLLSRHFTCQNSLQSLTPQGIRANSGCHAYGNIRHGIDLQQFECPALQRRRLGQQRERPVRLIRHHHLVQGQRDQVLQQGVEAGHRQAVPGDAGGALALRLFGGFPGHRRSPVGPPLPGMFILEQQRPASAAGARAHAGRACRGTHEPAPGPRCRRTPDGPPPPLRLPPNTAWGSGAGRKIVK